MATLALDELIHDLFVGITSDKPWDKFLTNLRAMTGADDANIAFLRRNSNWNDLLTVRDEPPFGAEKRLTWASFILSMSSKERKEWMKCVAALPYRTLQYDIPVALESLLAAGGVAEQKYFEKFLVPAHYRDSHALRVREPGGADGWLAISRRQGRFDGSAIKVLNAIVAPLRTAVGVRAEYEVQSRRTRLLSEAMTKLGHAWVLLDPTGNVIDGDGRGTESANRTEVKAAIKKALNVIGTTANPPAVAMRSGGDNGIELLVIPYQAGSTGDLSPATAIAFMHQETEELDPRGVAELAQMHKLTPAEARLAMALSRGRSIVEAAEDLAIGVGSARTYTKKIYAKTGARGQSDLVRNIRSGVISLA